MESEGDLAHQLAPKARYVEPTSASPDAWTWLDEHLGGRYRVLGPLGGGGMGQVFRVQHSGLRREFALKVLAPERLREPEAARQFEREIHATARLHSEHIVSVVDCGSFGDSHYLVMELLHGEDLRALLAREGFLPPRRVAHIGVDACLGLSVVHAAGTVHRDIKPSNLFLTRGDDGREVCKLIDFGASRVRDTRVTRSGTLLGTPCYMAPEQIDSAGELGAHTDVFALGATLYECLSGHSPFEADGLERTLFRIMNETPRALSDFCEHVPPALSRVIARALSHRPAERYPSALEFARALKPFTAREERLPIAPASAGASRTLGPAELTILDEASPLLRSAPRALGGRRWGLFLGLVGLVSLTPASRSLSTPGRVAVPVAVSSSESLPADIQLVATHDLTSSAAASTPDSVTARVDVGSTVVGDRATPKRATRPASSQPLSSQALPQGFAPLIRDRR
jgi:serine/threonine-protein kinase